LLGPFQGHVIDLATSAPVAGALVYATWSLERGGGLPAAAGFRERVGSTDAAGRYRIPVLNDIPRDVRVAAFSLLIYKRGFVAYRSDRRFSDLGPRFDFAQRSNQVLLERWRDDLSHARHLRFVGGGAAVAANSPMLPPSWTVAVAPSFALGAATVRTWSLPNSSAKRISRRAPATTATLKPARYPMKRIPRATPRNTTKPWAGPKAGTWRCACGG
jgi:hypothetical protein